MLHIWLLKYEELRNLLITVMSINMNCVISKFMLDFKLYVPALNLYTKY